MKFRVTVAYQGQKTYLVEAQTQAEAERIAGELSQNPRNRALIKPPPPPDPLADAGLRKDLARTAAEMMRLCINIKEANK